MILVVGGTGYLGGMIVRRLLSRGEQVRILVRQGSAYQPLVESGAVPVFGDLKEPESLQAACQGAHVVISTANAASRSGADTFQSVDDQGNRNLVDAARAAGVNQFIFISAVGADPQSPNPLFAAKGKTEAYLKESGLPYTILQGEAFMDAWVAMVVGQPVAEGRPVTLVGEGSRKHTFVAAADLAAFAEAAVQHPAVLNRTMAVGGPHALSFREVVTAFERKLGRSIPVQFVKPGEAVPNLPPMMSQILAGLESFDSAFDMQETAGLLGVTLTSIDQFAERFLAQAGVKA